MSPTAASMHDCAIAWVDPAREAAFHAWFDPLAQRHGIDGATLAPASSDASFRRYFRARAAQRSLIVMDAPPPHEDVRPFIEIAERIRRAGMNAPEVLAADAGQGFLLLSDLGTTSYLDALRGADAAGANRLMCDAVDALLLWQQQVDPVGLPPYDEALLRRELELFPAWCVGAEYGVSWGDAERAQWERICRVLIDSALAQPAVAVHRDWMPRNLMVADPNPGILDFQDAVRGPIAYDLASLLRDAFISWDEERELDWALRWWDAARRVAPLAGHPMGEDFGECWRALEWMGLQRHLKVLGIFCRLAHRDRKPQYRADLPRFFAYAASVATRYRPLAPLVGLIEPLAGPLTTSGFELR